MCVGFLFTRCSGSPNPPTDLPPPANTAPVIRSITASLPKIEIDQTVEFVAVVEDADTSVDRLQYVWSAAAGGVFSASGNRATWRPPAALATPAEPAIMVTVIETYPSRNAQGQTITGEYRVSGAATVRVHNSPAEVSRMARQFLEDFSRQLRPPEAVVKDFRSGCGVNGRGRELELFDVEKNQRERRIDDWSVQEPQVTIGYGGVCPFRNRRGDACAQVPVDWRDTQLVPIESYAAGSRWRSYGIDQVTAEYHENRWWLCDSDFDGVSQQLFSPTLRAKLALLPGSFFKK